METETEIADLAVIQSMIDISADRLEGLRTHCVTSAELTQQEIRTLETKLVRMFTEMLVTKERLPPERSQYKGLGCSGGAAELKQWLRVVGLSPNTLNAILHRVGTLEVLLEKSEAELKALLPIDKLDGTYDEEEARRLTRAMTSLRRCRQVDSGRGNKDESRLELLYWDSWDSRQSHSAAHHQHHHHHHHHHHNAHAKSTTSGNVRASPRSTRSHRHYYQQQQQQPQLAKLSTTALTSGVEDNNSGVQSPIETSPPESYNSQSSTSAAVQSPAEESSTMSTNLTPSPSPPMSPLQQGQQSQPPSSYSGSPNCNSPLPVIGGGGGNTPGTSRTGTTLTRPTTNVVQSGNANTVSQQASGGGGGGGGERFPSTPPPRIKHQQQTLTNNSQTEGCGTPTSLTSGQSTPWNGGSGAGPPPNNGQPVIIPKSKSHESQLMTNEVNSTQGSTVPSNNVATGEGAVIVASGMKTPRSRLHTEPGPDSANDLFGNKSPPVSATNNSLTVPRSPLTPISVVAAPTTTVPINSPTNNNNSSSGNNAANQMATLNHDIPHHFTKNFKLTTVTCNFCNRQMFYGLKCKECKYRCHKECEPQVPPSCGLPQQVFDMINSSPNMNRSAGGNSTLGGGVHHSSYAGKGASNLIMTGGDGRTAGGPDSSSAGSSCNSSSPSSPALLLSSSSGHNYYGSQFQHHPQTPQQAGVGAAGYVGHHKSQFSFPEVATVTNTEESTLYKNSEMVNSNISVLSDYRPPNSPRITLTADGTFEGDLVAQCGEGQYYNGGGGDLPPVQSPLLSVNATQIDTMGEMTAGVAGGAELTQEEKTGSTMSGSSTNTGGSGTDSERTPVRLDSTEERDSMAWPRQNSLSLKEWDIPYDDLRLLEQLGKGRFGTVHRALWHGDVAVKLLKEDYLDDERTLEAFKLEVAIFKNTRHENVVLFMGACMKPPRLAIVTSLCKGKTLYTHIYVCRDKFNLNKATMVAQQISQGMGYLHARGIVHKDLKTKNIFLENGKVIITDFGLFSATKLQYCDRGVEVQENWLCYLAPELIRGLKPQRVTDEDLSFSRASDVYAFGTVWYELLCGEFPFRKVPAESVIWQVGRGMKPTLANVQASRDVKDILMLCWAFQADDRKDFATLLTLLERLPKKRLARSPSHPVQLSKSAESVF